MSRYGSEPDLRVEETPPKPRFNNNKNFRKKYRAPQPPVIDVSNIFNIFFSFYFIYKLKNNIGLQTREDSSPDSSQGNSKTEPPRKLRLFKTRTETKKLNGHAGDSKIPMPYRNSYQDYKSLDINEDVGNRRYRPVSREKEQHLKYPDNKDMTQTNSSLKREDHIMQHSRFESKKSRDKPGGCKAKTTKVNEQSDQWKPSLLNRNFRHSDRFKREDSEQPPLRREKSFDANLLAEERKTNSPNNIHANRMKVIGEQLKASRKSPLVTNDNALRKSLPSLLLKSNEEKDEFQAELKKATNKIRKEISSKVNLVSENKPSQSDRKLSNVPRPNTTKNTSNKVKESSLQTKTKNIQIGKLESSATKLANSRRTVTRTNDVNSKSNIHNNIKANTPTSKDKLSNKVDSQGLADRGQASGKESTPEHSPTRTRNQKINDCAKEM